MEQTKINLAKATLKDIKHIYQNGFKKTAHPDIWQDLTAIMTRVDMLLMILETDEDDNKSI